MRRWLMPLVLAVSLATFALAAGEDAAIEKTLANPPATGLVVTFVAEDSQAGKVGLRSGDVIVSYGGVATPTLPRLVQVIGEQEKERRVEIRFFRDGKEEKAIVEGGRLGAGLLPVEKGKPLTRPEETSYEPNFAPLKSGETYYNFTIEGAKQGFQRDHVAVAGDRITFDRTTRFQLGEQSVYPRMRLTLRRDRYLTLESLTFTAGDEKVGELKRVGNRLKGEHGGEPVDLEAPANVIPSWAVDLVAQTMPRKVGACLYYTILDEGSFTLSPRFELVCAALEKVNLGEREVDAYRYDEQRFNQVVTRRWVTADGNLVQMEYGGPIAARTNVQDALANLPKGVSTKF